MAPKLYGLYRSPPTRAVLLCAKGLNLELEFVLVNLYEKEHLSDDFLKKNPQHTIPVLEDEDGFILSDSHAIMAYLVSKYGKDDTLYPSKDLKQRAIINHRLHFDSSTLFARSVAITKPLFLLGVKPSEDRYTDFKEALGFLDKILENTKTDYVAGNNITIADFSIINTVTNADRFVPYGDFPQVTAYVEKFKKTVYYKLNEDLANTK